ncbi:sulfatase-like hydrolase/transferase [Dyadobacter sp. CY326]|uniref:sulfatase-like hydrolase/transferase n=1 Tax=Dyadobacter sp. CY326 TaxID=2907300 RepID=UPI001F48F5F9|nr:sulfatase-like hydrolase/transferase [Dyadobacter sp. CY326]MCE7066631.1 sulfatase-like hydrolase/transferase [Dyadobacter sp. CY326]
MLAHTGGADDRPASGESGITDYLDVKDEKFLSPDYITLNEQLAKAGYHSGLIGKWHLTGDYDKKKGAPDKHGWDEIICSETRYIAGGAYYHPYFFMPELEAKSQGEYLTDRLNNEAVDFIKRNQKQAFLLYLSHYSVHTKLKARTDKVGKHQSKPGAGTDKNNPELAAMLESIDDGVGQIVQTLRALGLEKNTLIIFTSDNGGETKVTSNAPLRGGKSQLYEGGIRVPLIAYWPEKIKAGATSSVAINTLDIFPTFSEIAGLEASAVTPYSGTSIWPLLSGKGDIKARNLYWHYPLAKPHFLGGRSAGAIRSGDFKLIEFFDDQTAELYDLKQDPFEQHNLAASNPEKTKELKKQLAKWREGIAE